jgi:hypothetical protein
MHDAIGAELGSKWRERARDMRVLAFETEEPVSRAAMRQLAEFYDYLADIKLGLRPGDTLPTMDQYVAKVGPLRRSG